MSFPMMPRPAPDTVLRSLSVVATATSTTDAVVAPGDVRPGDILVMFDAPDSTGSINTASVPAGFTILVNRPSSGWPTKVVASFRVCDGSEGGTTISGMNGDETNAKILLQVRGNIRLTGCSVYDLKTAQSNGDPSVSPSVLSALSPASAPIMALGTVHHKGSGGAAFQSQTPAFTSETAIGHLRIGQTIYAKGATVSDQGIDKDDGGTSNILTVCGLRFS